MTVKIGPLGGAAQAIEVRSQEPWNAVPVTVHRGLGGVTQNVWTAAPPDAGARITVRTTPTELPALLAMLHAPGRLEVTTDDPTRCAIQTGTGVVIRTNTVLRYDLTPAGVDVTIELAYT